LFYKQVKGKKEAAATDSKVEAAQQTNLSLSDTILKK
jgi:hypothetical protein